jgi:two-component system sensor histidine kinase KdpD
VRHRLDRRERRAEVVRHGREERATQCFEATLALGPFRLGDEADALDAETERLRSTLLTGISHDFRTPLTTIVGVASSLLEQDEAIDPARRKLMLDSVLAEAQRLHALMSDLLDLMRMEEGSVQPSCEWCPADELVGAARAALGARLVSHRLRVQPCGDTLVWCDARLLEQALVNLFDNAVRYTAAGSTIDVRIEPGAEQCRIVVADDGPGLPAGRERDVFLKFFRGRSEPTDGGTGMGLAICAAVARLHGGRIDARNDGGACFTLTLPQPATPRLSEAA